MMSLTEENYLKVLYRLLQDKQEITVKDIAEQLSIKMPTVNSMIKKLAQKKLLRYEKYKAIELTEKGKKQALLILRKHRLIELFLKDIMGLGWEEVHDIAEQVEHIQSELFFTRIDEMLGNPSLIRMANPYPTPMANYPSTKPLLCLRECLTKSTSWQA